MWSSVERCGEAGFKFLLLACWNDIERSNPGHSLSQSLLDFSIITLYWAFSWGKVRKIVFERSIFSLNKCTPWVKCLFGQMISGPVHICEWRCPFSQPLCAQPLLPAHPRCHCGLVLSQWHLQPGAVAGLTPLTLPSQAPKPPPHLCFQRMHPQTWETLTKISNTHHITAIICKFPSQLPSDKVWYGVMQNAYLSLFL